MLRHLLKFAGAGLFAVLAFAPASAAATPVVTSVSGPADGLYGTGHSLVFIVHFDQAIAVAGAPLLVLNVPGVGTQYANYAAGNDTPDLVFHYEVVSGTPNNTTGVTLAGSFDMNGGTLRDFQGEDANPTLNNPSSLAGLTLDGTAPTATSIALVGTPPSTSLTVSYTVTFSESVTGVAAGAFAVATVDGTASGQVGTVGGSGNSYTVAVNNIGGIGHLRLELKDSSTGIADLAGNAIGGGFHTGDQFQANVQRICLVNAAATGANDGSSWADAYTDLQSAVRNAGCIEDWVAKGIYKPGTATTDSFQPRAGVKLYGGFAGTESSVAERTASVIAANPSVLSGDIDNNDATDANGVVLDAMQIAGSNSVNVVLMNNGGSAGYGTDTVIDGFIITAGSGGNGDLGGGLRCDASLQQAACNFTISNMVFSGNRAGGGGALSLTSSAGTANAVVSKVLFRGNQAIGPGASGGAVSLSANPSAGTVKPAFTNVIFSGNTSLNWGGAIDLNVNQGTVMPTFDNATFTGNISTVQRGGAIASQAFGTGGVARATFYNSILWGDAANAGDPEIVLDFNGAVAINQSILQGGCPTSANAYCSGMIAGDPLLGALGNYGGAVASIVPGTGSVAIDAGGCVLMDDIRGVSRPQGAGCDVGAVEVRLSVLTATVNGGGRVSAGAVPAPMGGGINCTSICSATYDGEVQPTVTLTATPNAQQSFSGWSGDCSGSNAITTIAMTAAKNCTATFVANTTNITLALTGGSNPSVHGDTLSVTATVTAVAPATPAPNGGRVIFYDGGVLFATFVLNNGTAAFTTLSLDAGTHVFTAQYDGDANYAAAVQPVSAPLTQVITPITPTLTWAAPSPIVYGTQLSDTQLNATATYNGNSVAGTFAYTPAAGMVLGGGANQTLSVAFTPTDTTNFTNASATTTITVNRAASTTTLSSSCMLSFVENQPITLDADVAGANATGTVAFNNGQAGTLCVNVALGSGTATCTSSALKVAGGGVQSVYNLTASYSGDGNHQPSTSNALTVTVLSAADVVFRDGFEAETLSCPIE